MGVQSRILRIIRTLTDPAVVADPCADLRGILEAELAAGRVVSDTYAFSQTRRDAVLRESK
jgi:hypothetical protein